MPFGWVAAGSAILGAFTSEDAAKKQSDAQKQGAATEQHMFDTINAQEQPFIQQGYGANTQLSQLLGTGGDPSAANYGSFAKPFTAKDYLANQDPGYQFQLQTGAQALRNADTPGVGSLSGPALKDLIGFNQGMAATGYQNAFNRFTTQQNNIFSRLSDLSTRGQNAASNTGQAGTALGQGIAQAQAAAGGSQAAGIVGAGNSLANGSTLAYLMSGNGNTNPGGVQGYATGTNNGLFDSSGGYHGNTPADLAGAT